MCGYNKNIAALEFHHVNPEEKEFEIDIRHFSNTSLQKLKEEVNKCILLCANCHRELHNPKLYMDDVVKIVNQAHNKKSFNVQNHKNTCPICGKEFNKIGGKIYCSQKCRDSERYFNYPTIDEIEKQYNELDTWEKVAQSFGLTRKIIQGVRKRAGKL